MVWRKIDVVEHVQDSLHFWFFKKVKRKNQLKLNFNLLLTKSGKNSYSQDSLYFGVFGESASQSHQAHTDVQATQLN